MGNHRRTFLEELQEAKSHSYAVGAFNIFNHLSARAVVRAAEELGVPEEKSVLLQHMLLSHHGQPEFGAAVVPMCAESELLSLIDTVDSRMQIYREAMAEIQPGEFSKRIFALEKRIYRHE